MTLLLRHDGWVGRIIRFALGGLAVCGQAPLHIWPITIICLALLYMRLHYAAQSARPRKAGFHSGMWFALGYFSVSIFWVGSAFIARGPEFVLLMPPMVLALAALLAVFWGFASAIYTAWLSRARPSAFWAVIAFTSFFFLAEFARGHAFGGLPWNLVGYIFKAGSAPSQIAVLVNIYGLTWLVLYVSACLGQSVQSRLTSKSVTSPDGPLQSLMPALTGIGLIAGLFLYGHLRLSSANEDIVEGVKIRIVNVPFDQSEHLDPQKSVNIVRRFLAQSLASGVEDVTHIVWPEGAALGLAMDDYGLLSAMGQGLVAYDNTPPVWLMQSLRLEIQRDLNTNDIINNYYNSSVAITFDASGYPAVSAYNDKHRLVPFGEFIPGGKWLESRIPVISASLASLSPAKRKALSNFPGLPRVSPQICYEALFPNLTPNDLKRPAELILNQSNDAWYGKSWGPLQHANMARYRAIEQGLPMIRVASNGLSGITNPYGQTDQILTAVDESHIDAYLPKSLKLNKNTKLIILILALINFLISLMCLRLYFVGKGIET